MSPPQALRSASSHSISVCPVVPPWSPAPGVHGDIIILLRSRTTGSCLKIPSLSGGKASAEPGVDKSRGFSVSLAQTVVRACLSCALYVSRMSSFVYVLVFVVCSPAYRGCITTTSNQTFSSRQECVEAAGRLAGVQSATCKPRRVFVQ